MVHRDGAETVQQRRRAFQVAHHDVVRLLGLLQVGVQLRLSGTAGLGRQQSFMLWHPTAVVGVAALLKECSLDAWKDFLAFHAINTNAAHLPQAFTEQHFDFYGRTLNGTPELRARWKRGVALVEGALGEAVGKEYVARHFPPRSKELMDDLVANLLAAYRESISTLDWMTEETKERAYEKLATFRPKIGYPETFRDYSALQVTPDDLLGNVAAASGFETDRQLAKIGAPVDRDEWFMLPQT
eukprot:gene28577-32276_t